MRLQSVRLPVSTVRNACLSVIFFHVRKRLACVFFLTQKLQLTRSSNLLRLITQPRPPNLLSRPAARFNHDKSYRLECCDAAYLDHQTISSSHSDSIICQGHAAGNYESPLPEVSWICQYNCLGLLTAISQCGRAGIRVRVAQ